MHTYAQNCGFKKKKLFLFAIILLTNFCNLAVVFFTLRFLRTLELICQSANGILTNAPAQKSLNSFFSSVCRRRCADCAAARLYIQVQQLSQLCISAVFFLSFLQSQCSRGSSQFKLQSGSALLSWTTIWTEARKSGGALRRMETWLCSNLLKEEKAAAASAAAAVIITSWSFDERFWVTSSEKLKYIWCFSTPVKSSCANCFSQTVDHTSRKPCFVLCLKPGVTHLHQLMIPKSFWSH